jgi:hypothetical protein
MDGTSIAEDYAEGELNAMSEDTGLGGGAAGASAIGWESAQQRPGEDAHDDAPVLAKDCDVYTWAEPIEADRWWDDDLPWLPMQVESSVLTPAAHEFMDEGSDWERPVGGGDSWAVPDAGPFGGDTFHTVDLFAHTVDLFATPGISLNGTIDTDEVPRGGGYGDQLSRSRAAPVVTEQCSRSSAGLPMPVMAPLSRRALANDTRRFRPTEVRAAGTGSMQRLAEVVQSAYSESWRTKTRDAWRFYSNCCTAVGIQALPVQTAAVAHFMVDRVARQGLMAEGVMQTVGFLHRAVTMQFSDGLWQVDEAGGEYLRMVARALQKRWPKQNVRGKKQPVQLHHLAKMRRHRESAGLWSADDEHHWLQMLMAHQGFLRTAEHVSGRLRGSDVCCILSDDGSGKCVGLRLTLRDAKTSTGQRQHQEVYLVRRSDEFDVVGPLLQLLADRQDPLGPLFRESSGSATSRGDFVRRTKQWLSEAGYPAAQYSGHSFRAGGTTDAFDSGVPFDIIIAQGRWKSDAWKEYRRSTVQLVYSLERMRMQPSLATGPAAARAATAELAGGVASAVSAVVPGDRDPRSVMTAPEEALVESRKEAAAQAAGRNFTVGEEVMLDRSATVGRVLGNRVTDRGTIYHVQVDRWIAEYDPSRLTSLADVQRGGRGRRAPQRLGDED